VQEMSKGKFRSATLRSDGIVEVTGPFSLPEGEPKNNVLVVFHLVQHATTITGDGRWSVGQLEWSGTGGSGLKAGLPQAAALAILARDDPPGFLTFSWSEQVEVKAADPSN
jgi:hypothetical protein